MLPKYSELELIEFEMVRPPARCGDSLHVAALVRMQPFQPQGIARGLDDPPHRFELEKIKTTV
jgi:hypothetical protein